MKILRGQHWPEYGIEADPINGPEFSKIIKVPFAMHDEHKDSWCPVANSLPAVRSHLLLNEAEAVSLFGAHSIGRVGRAGKTPCNYMSNHFFCPSMCGKNLSKSGGMRYNQGFVFDDTPEIMDNRYFANMMHEDFDAIPHCVALGATGGISGAVPGYGTQADGRWTDLPDERNQGIVRLGVMGLGCQPTPWAPVVDENLTRPCVGGYKTQWKDQSQCEVDNCVHKCIEDGVCHHAWNDPSQECRNCKFDCDDFFDKFLPRYMAGETRRRTIGTLTKMWEIGNGEWAPTLRHYEGDGTPKANISELRQFRWCKYTDSREGEPLLGQGRSDRWKDHLIFAPGPVDPDSREWGGAGMVQNMEQFAFLHGNPTPIFNLPVDWTLLGTPGTKQWVIRFGEDNQLFEKTFASAWKKVLSAGWNAKAKPKTGWSGASLKSCKRTKCTATNGKFWCPVNVLSDRLRYLPKPASLRLVLGECTDDHAHATVHATVHDTAPGACELVGGHGVRGIVQCGEQRFRCCSERACEWEKWLKKHREADMSDSATCPFTQEEKKAEVQKTVETWRTKTDIDYNGKHGISDPHSLGYDYLKAQDEADVANTDHAELAKSKYFEYREIGNLTKEIKCDYGNKGAPYGSCIRWGADQYLFEWTNPNVVNDVEWRFDDIWWSIGLMNKPM